MRVAAGLLALPLLLSLGAVASADDGPPARTVGRATELPPRRAIDKQVVLLVGGLGSESADGTWDELIARYQGDPGYEIRRFGADPRLPYDTVGAVDDNAQRLISQVGTLSRYSAIHIVTHSMGGVVADRAFATGLSSADRVRSYIALAAPHNGATAARAITTTLALAGKEGETLRALVAGVTIDPGGAAARDLARDLDPPAPAGIARLDVRLATDLVVLDRDSRLGDVDSRVFLPSSADTLEGHGGILRDDRVLDLVTSTIAQRTPPADERGLLLLAATELVNGTAQDVALLGLTAGMLTVLFAAWKLREMRWLLEPLGMFRRRRS